MHPGSTGTTASRLDIKASMALAQRPSGLSTTTRPLHARSTARCGAGGAGAPAARGQVPAALLEGGADPGGFLATTIEPTEAEHAALTAACKRASARAKQRWHNVVAAVAIVAFWRRLAAEPDSKAARAAIERCAKRARGD